MSERRDPGKIGAVATNQARSGTSSAAAVEALRRLVGLERHLWLTLGAKKIPASFDDRQMSTEKISAVQFVRFALEGVGGAELLELARKGEAAIVADHPGLAAHGAISGLVASSLAEDLN